MLCFDNTFSYKFRFQKDKMLNSDSVEFYHLKAYTQSHKIFRFDKFYLSFSITEAFVLICNIYFINK